MKSFYLYHGVPANLQGDILYPLNQLREIYPEVYAQHVKRYDWRPEVMEKHIPFLNCLWNDVIFLTAVPPQNIRDALVASGGQLIKNRHCYQIDPTLLDVEKTIVALAPHLELTEANCVEYNPSRIADYATIPQETIDYYKREISRGESPLLYHRIPHILYKGTINVSSLTQIVVNN